jgi:hypothetical protein
MSGGVESQYSPIIGDVIEPPSYRVNLSQLKNNAYFITVFIMVRNRMHLTKNCPLNPIQNEETLCQSVDQFVIEYSKYNLFHFYRAEEIQVM